MTSTTSPTPGHTAPTTCAAPETATITATVTAAPSTGITTCRPRRTRAPPAHLRVFRVFRVFRQSPRDRHPEAIFDPPNAALRWVP